MTSGPSAETPPLSQFLRPELPAAALHGLPGEVAVTLAAATGEARGGRVRPLAADRHDSARRT